MNIESILQNLISAIARPVDDRDWPIATVPAPIIIPPNFVPHIYNQGSIEPECGAGMCATLVNFVNPGVVCSMEYIWIQNRLLDKLPVGSGSNLRTLFKALQNSGSCDETLLEANVLEPLTLYVSPANLTRAIVLNAMPRRINFYGFQDGPFTFQGIQDTANKYHVVACQIHLGNRFYQDAQGNNSYNPAVLFPLHYGTAVSDHFITLISHDLAKVYDIAEPNPAFQYFINEWSTAYGQNGIGWFDQTYLPYIVELGVVSK